jgi:hypothetical protein
MDSVVEFSAVASCACCLFTPIHVQRFQRTPRHRTWAVVAVRVKIANCSVKAGKGNSKKVAIDIIYVIYFLSEYRMTEKCLSMLFDLKMVFDR